MLGSQSPKDENREDLSDNRREPSLLYKQVSINVSIVCGSILGSIIGMDSYAVANQVLGLVPPRNSLEFVMPYWSGFETVFVNGVQSIDSFDKVFKSIYTDGLYGNKRRSFIMMALISFSVSAIKMWAIKAQGGDRSCRLIDVISLLLSGFSGINYLWGTYKKISEKINNGGVGWLSVLCFLLLSPSLVAGGVNTYFGVFGEDDSYLSFLFFLKIVAVVCLCSGSICSRFSLGDFLNDLIKVLSSPEKKREKIQRAICFGLTGLAFSGGYNTLVRASLQTVNLLFGKAYQSSNDITRFSQRIFFYLIIFNSSNQNYLVFSKQFISLSESFRESFVSSIQKNNAQVQKNGHDKNELSPSGGVALKVDNFEFLGADKLTMKNNGFCSCSIILSCFSVTLFIPVIIAFFRQPFVQDDVINIFVEWKSLSDGLTEVLMKANHTNAFNAHDIISYFISVNNVSAGSGNASLLEWMSGISYNLSCDAMMGPVRASVLVSSSASNDFLLHHSHYDLVCPISPLKPSVDLSYDMRKFDDQLELIITAKRADLVGDKAQFLLKAMLDHQYLKPRLLNLADLLKGVAMPLSCGDLKGELSFRVNVTSKDNRTIINNATYEDTVFCRNDKVNLAYGKAYEKDNTIYMPVTIDGPLSGSGSITLKPYGNPSLWVLGQVDVEFDGNNKTIDVPVMHCGGILNVDSGLKASSSQLTVLNPDSGLKDTFCSMGSSNYFDVEYDYDEIEYPIRDVSELEGYNDVDTYVNHEHFFSPISTQLLSGSDGSLVSGASGPNLIVSHAVFLYMGYRTVKSTAKSVISWFMPSR